MNRRSFMGLLGIAPVALKAAPLASGPFPFMQSARSPFPASVATEGISIRYIREWPRLEEDDLVSSALCLIGVMAPGEKPSKTDYGFVAMLIVEGDTPATLAAKIAPAFGVGVHRFYSDELMDCVREYSGTMQVVS